MSCSTASTAAPLVVNASATLALSDVDHLARGKPYTAIREPANVDGETFPARPSRPTEPDMLRPAIGGLKRLTPAALCLTTLASPVAMTSAWRPNLALSTLRI